MTNFGEPPTTKVTSVSPHFYIKSNHLISMLCLISFAMVQIYVSIVNTNGSINVGMT